MKNQGKASAYRRLSSPFSIAIQLLYYDGLGDWKYINSYADEVDRVTAADIQRVARAYLTRENRTVGVFLRKAGTAAEAGSRKSPPCPRRRAPDAAQLRRSRRRTRRVGKASRR